LVGSRDEQGLDAEERKKAGMGWTGQGQERERQFRKVQFRVQEMEVGVAEEGVDKSENECASMKSEDGWRSLA